jgi:hypothetical protein
MSTEIPQSRKINIEPASTEELRAAFLIDGEANVDKTSDNTAANEAYNNALKEELERQEKLDGKNRTKNMTKFALIGAGVAALGIGGAVTVNEMAANANHTSAPQEHPAQPSHIAGDILPTAQPTSGTLDLPSSSPSPAGTTALETAPVTHEKPSSYTVDQLEAMSVDEYNNLSHADRMVLIKHFLEQAQDVSLSYGKDIYEFNPLDVASKSNTPQEVIKQIEFQMQMALFQKESPTATDTRINKDNALKAVGAAAYDTSKASMPAYMISERINPLTNISNLADVYDHASEHLPIQTMEDPITHKTIEYRTIEFVDQKGAPHIAKVTYAQLDASKGIWQLLSIV